MIPNIIGVPKVFNLRLGHGIVQWFSAFWLNYLWSGAPKKRGMTPNIVGVPKVFNLRLGHGIVHWFSPSRAAVPVRGHSTLILSNLSPKRECSAKKGL